jgi:glycosyltransferase involved in cell wall biosynthesis
MRIAIVIWQLDMYGGSIRQALELALQLKEKGHKVDFFTYRVDKKKCFPELLKKIKIITPVEVTYKQKIYDPNGPLLARAGYFAYNAFVQSKQVAALAKIIKERHGRKKYDVINLHDNGLLSIPQHIKDARFVWMMNDPPSFIDTHEKQASTFSNSLLLRFLVKVQMFESRILLRRVEEISVLDNRNARIVEKYFQRVAKIVRSGLDIPSELLTLKKPSNKKMKILTTNIFFRHRRYEDLVEAARILVQKKKQTNVQFRVVGASDADEGYYSEILALVEKYSLLEYFVFLGRVSEQQLKSEYKNADVFVFPNHNQTWGLSVFEALLNKCAVIVSATSGAHEVLSNNVNAKIIPSKNPKALAQALLELASDSKSRKKMARLGQKFVLENISWSKYADQMSSIFLGLKHS